MGFYGLSQNTSDLPGSPYVTFMLTALVELPGYVLAVPLMQYWGRKPTLVLLFAVGGISCILAGILTHDVIVVTLAMLGKMCVAAAFAVAYNYAAELFPTVVRQTGTGYASVCARIGSLLAPQIRLLGDFSHKQLPIMIYGAVCLAAAALDLLLPETLNEELPETIDDGINFGVKQKAADATAPHHGANATTAMLVESKTPPPKMHGAQAPMLA